MKPTPCIHRGPQRREACCGGKLISRFICRLLRQEDGVTPMDCVPTSITNDAIRDAAPSAFHENWSKCVAVCEKCPHYEAK
jgi:hypothetical protein